MRLGLENKPVIENRRRHALYVIRGNKVASGHSRPGASGSLQVETRTGRRTEQKLVVASCRIGDIDNVRAHLVRHMDATHHRRHLQNF